jgi:DNA-binding transcriptional MerR regulator
MSFDCTIGDAARRAGVGIETIRFYERRKLLARPLKPKSGAPRRYSQDAIARLALIKQLQRSGFSLKEIATLLALKDKGRAGCASLSPIIRTKIMDLREEIAALERILGSLENLVTNCQTGDAECPALTNRRPKFSGRTANGRNKQRLHAVSRRPNGTAR